MQPTPDDSRFQCESSATPDIRIQAKLPRAVSPCEKPSLSLPQRIAALRGPLLGAALGAFIMLWLFGVERVQLYDHRGWDYSPSFQTVRESKRYYYELSIKQARDSWPDQFWRACAFPLQEMDRKAPEGQLVLMLLGGLIGISIAYSRVVLSRVREGRTRLAVVAGMVGAFAMLMVFGVPEAVHKEFELNGANRLYAEQFGVTRTRTADEVRRWEDYVHTGSIDAAKDRQADKLWRDHAGPWSDMDRLAVEGKLFLMLVGGLLGAAFGYTAQKIHRAVLRRLQLQRQKLAFVQESGSQMRS